MHTDTQTSPSDVAKNRQRNIFSRQIFLRRFNLREEMLVCFHFSRLGFATELPTIKDWEPSFGTRALPSSDYKGPSFQDLACHQGILYF
jgi:hypothetical protein